jgi:hypothetical protein
MPLELKTQVLMSFTATISYCAEEKPLAEAPLKVLIMLRQKEAATSINLQKRAATPLNLQGKVAIGLVLVKSSSMGAEDF